MTQFGPRALLAAFVGSCTVCCLAVSTAPTRAAESITPASTQPGGDATAPQVLVRLAHHGGKFAEFSRDGSLLLTAGAADVQVWDARTFRPVGKPVAYPADFVTCGFAAGGRIAFIADQAGIALWDPLTGNRFGMGIKAPLPIFAAAVSPDGRMAATSFAVWPSEYSEPNVHLFDVATGKELRRLAHPHDAIFVAFSPDSRELLTMDKHGMRSCAFHVWDVATGLERFAPIETYCDSNCPPGSTMRPAAFSHDGTQIAVSAGNRFAVIDAASGRRLCGDVPGEYGGWNNGVAFTADGKWVWGRGLLYSAASSERAEFPYVREAVTRFSLSPGGLRLAGVYETGIHDGEPTEHVGLWDLRTGKQLGDFGMAADDGLPAFSPSGKQLAITGCGNDRNDTVIWDLRRK